jgi:hypothetical protein
MRIHPILNQFRIGVISSRRAAMPRRTPSPLNAVRIHLYSRIANRKRIVCMLSITALLHRHVVTWWEHCVLTTTKNIPKLSASIRSDSATS